MSDPTSIKTGHLTIGLDHEEHPGKLSMAGRIDERANLDELVERVAPRIFIDLEEITAISSFGIRMWVRFLRALRDRGVVVRLTRCSPVMVSQMNLIPETRAPVDSFMASFECESCGEDGLPRIIDVSKERAVLSRGKLPGFWCEACGQLLILEDDEDRFLLFLEL